MSITELEELTAIPDLLPICPVRLDELEWSLPDSPQDYLPARFWQYRVCGA